ncbi:MAG: hypothetical protein HQK89_04170 [Nitrospirae bacterium]|nr:hypothetical protein [Nitrospirota bacterium]
MVTHWEDFPHLLIQRKFIEKTMMLAINNVRYQHPERSNADNVQFPLAVINNFGFVGENVKRQ